MKREERIRELERRVEELESRPPVVIYQPVTLPQPSPYTPLPGYPWQNSPNICGSGTGDFHPPITVTFS